MKLAKPRSLAVAALVAICLPALQGCVPAVAVGAGATALMISDRRTSGTYVEDEGIEFKAMNRIEERFHGKVHVNVTSFNRNVLITGEAPDQASKDELAAIVAGVENVRSVTNEAQIAGISSLGSRSNDTFLTGKIKARFIDSNTFPAHVVKVVTEGGTVYLMGMVTQREGDRASEIASTTGGVQKVVRVFEYVTREKAWELDRRPPEKADADKSGSKPAP
ncbi:MAG: BON domain-containing protein [Rhodocyclaceae bacterium]|nr:BON domain-containing protein [Rhodocyclaceae bacterium]